MTRFSTKDLAFSGYSKTVATNKNHESIDFDYVNKTDEKSVTDFCNSFLENYNVAQTKANFQKVETFLQHPYLENAVYSAHLSDWIASNWIKKII
ncbi:hypothetical protein SAMN05444395_102377 [Flavobacterium fryxellicola]|uniref:Uncharacterized protein n=1 Tax=Flavobacterium fryxellicola TaxID=249352 RepID=A0A167Y0L6_9FLAO|nr:hypothetical protein [Flavobacterium fryxellicola]OAB28896.1 hypothetical protein FBFR_05405 [Flavobacterium fryxellicola]SHN60393.1 hypothetical protein SAMN05444395_102377 [Flavobacterium fryxellicola]